MKKIKILQPGSEKETAFLNKAAQAGYRLTKANWGCYSFEASEEIKEQQVISEFSNTSLSSLHRETAAELGLPPMVERKLLCLKHYLIYSYLPQSENIAKEDDQSQVAELDYWQANRMEYNFFQSWIGSFLIFCWMMLMLAPIFGWGSFSPFVLALPLIIWICWFAWYLRYASRRKKRMRQLERATGDFRDTPILRWLITIKHQQQEPDLAGLTHLGTWKLVTTSKKGQDYYYYLHSSLSQEAITTEVTTALGLVPEDFSIVPPYGLFPLGYFIL